MLLVVNNLGKKILSDFQKFLYLMATGGTTFLDDGF